MPVTHAVFELSLTQRLNKEIELSTLYIDTDDIDRRAGPAPLDLEQLLDVARDADSRAYSKRLADSLFANAEIREIFTRARDETIGADKPLRVRLVLNNVAELHALDWERLGGLDDDEPLFRGGGIWFSRWLNSLDWSRAPSTAPRNPSAVIAIANPTDLNEYGDDLSGHPQEIPVEEELDRARQALTTWRLDETLAGGQPATLDGLIEKLKERPDVLYLVCHGLAKAEKAVLLLEGDNRTTDVVGASEFVDRITTLGHRPRLVVLASCQSVGGGDDIEPDPGAKVRWRLGPELCKAGVPAVLAMQGNLSQQSAVEFLPKFFEGATKHGQLDRAMTEARFAIRGRHDWSVPTLFMRLRSGRLWARANPDHEFTKWPAVITAIKNGKCVPVLGAGASDVIVGTTRNISHALASERKFPLAAYQADDFPQVSQFVHVTQGRDVLRDDVLRLLDQSLQDRYGHLFKNDGINDIDAKFAAVSRHLGENDITEPHEVVARLPFPLYVTAEPTDLLAQAIAQLPERNPVRAYFRWRLSNPLRREELIDWPDDPLFGDDGYSATDPSKPVVYHLFGQLGTAWSVTLTEDDFFEFLIGVNSEKETPLHPAVTKALTNHTILFLGFAVDDWPFRVLLRTIAQYRGSRKLEIPHIAVQLDPDEDRTLAPDRARAYLTEFLGKSDMAIYWGSAELFAHELAQKAREAGIYVE